MPPLPGRKGTRQSLWKRAAAAGSDEVSGSSCGTYNHFGEDSASPLLRLDAGDGAVGLAVEQSFR